MTPAARLFELVSPFSPTGDQPQAIESLAARLGAGAPAACLLGATGTGKTFTMAHVIARLQKPTLIISHNKTLAAQLYEEMKELFPRNGVHYFVSYYDYYQPEAYIPQRDIYIEKDSSKNPELDALRLAATSSILSRRDTIVVASVSCIFGLGSPTAYGQRLLTLTVESPVSRRDLFLALNAMQYTRADVEFQRARYRVRGDCLEVWPAYEKFAVRVEFGPGAAGPARGGGAATTGGAAGGGGDTIERIELINPTSGEVLGEEPQFFLFPAVHHVMPEDRLQEALRQIREELDARVTDLRAQGRLLEAQRLIARTRYDLELIEETGSCPGIENYSRFMDGRAPGERPYTLLDYFDHAPPGGDGAATRPRDWLLIIDESHVTVPQVRAMFNGDRQRKEVLVEHGFRLPSALDNRPLRFEEFESIVPQTLFVSATPGSYELERVGGDVAEQVIRPTGLLDPRIEVRPADGQVPDLLERCRRRAAAGERVLVTALTKRLCEDLTAYLHQQGLRVRYLHSEIETLQRVEILTDLRAGRFDVLVGVNLLREGLDLPEVSLVCILDADKEGFLRSPSSLIQQMGRAARNVNAEVVMYADSVTPAMEAAIRETERRRAKQLAYNERHGIIPRTVEKAIRRGLELTLKARRTARQAVADTEKAYDIDELILELEGEMLEAAQSLEFERAARLRDQVNLLRDQRAGFEAQARRAGGAAAKPKVRRSQVEAALDGRAGGARSAKQARAGAGGQGVRDGTQGWEQNRPADPAPGMPGSRPGRASRRGRSRRSF